MAILDVLFSPLPFHLNYPYKVSSPAEKINAKTPYHINKKYRFKRRIQLKSVNFVTIINNLTITRETLIIEIWKI